MDGTLWDAVETYTRAWNLYFERHKLAKRLKKSDLDSLMGLEEQEFLEIVLHDFPEHERSGRYEDVVRLQYELIDKQGGDIYDGVLEMIPQLSDNYKLFIVSNSPEYTIHHFMKFARIDPYIIDSISHGQNYKAKHLNIKTLIKKYDLKRPIYIGDTEADCLHSDKAGIPFIFMTYGFGTCDSFLQSFDCFKDFAFHYLRAAKSE